MQDIHEVIFYCQILVFLGLALQDDHIKEDEVGRAWYTERIGEIYTHSCNRTLASRM